MNRVSCLKCISVVLGFSLTFANQLPVFCHEVGDEEQAYMQSLQDRFLSRFFPPRGGWAFSNGIVEATLQKDGNLENVKIIQHLTDKGRTSRTADQALQGALLKANPVPLPPQEIVCPVRLTVKFLVISKKHGGYRCKIEYPVANCKWE